MLMLTHAWLLAHFLGNACFEEENRDLFIYNVCPDFLPIHRKFTSDMTHGVSRFRELPEEYRKAAFIHFHLMADDISHHGLIDKIPVSVFNPASSGYTYVKGRPLVPLLIDLYNRLGKPIDGTVAAYRSHMIIEMTFDLSLYQGASEECGKLITAMCDAMQGIVHNRLNDFSKTVAWLYDVSPGDIEAATRQCAAFYTQERMNRFMSIEGRVKLFGNKFGLNPADGESMSMLKDMMTEGMALVRDYEEFLDPTLDAIRKVGFNPYV